MGGGHRLMARGQPSTPRSLRPCQEPPSHHIQIRQAAADLRQWVSFASPRYRTLAQPKLRLMIKKACSTFARTFDFVRF